jgi:hypothetical protein
MHDTRIPYLILPIQQETHATRHERGISAKLMSVKRQAGK